MQGWLGRIYFGWWVHCNPPAASPPSPAAVQRLLPRQPCIPHCRNLQHGGGFLSRARFVSPRVTSAAKPTAAARPWPPPPVPFWGVGGEGFFRERPGSVVAGLGRSRWLPRGVSRGQGRRRLAPRAAGAAGVQSRVVAPCRGILGERRGRPDAAQTLRLGGRRLKPSAAARGEAVADAVVASLHPREAPALRAQGVAGGSFLVRHPP